MRVVLKLRRRLVGDKWRRDGDLARDRHLWDEAMRQYSKHLELFPEDEAIWVQLGHAEKERGNLEQAIAAYLRALALNWDNADSHLQLGHVHKLLGRIDQAAASYQIASLYEPDSETVSAELAWVKSLHAFSFTIPDSAQRPNNGGRPEENGVSHNDLSEPGHIGSIAEKGVAALSAELRDFIAKAEAISSAAATQIQSQQAIDQTAASIEALSRRVDLIEQTLTALGPPVSGLLVRRT